MLKRLASLKYGIFVLIVLGMSIFVSSEDQKARNNYEQECNEFNTRLTTPLNRHEDCDKGAENAARHLPRWYRVFGWPEGITTWAILLTLLSIAEQTHETRRAADAANRALLSTMRPKVIIRRIGIHYGTQFSTSEVPDPDPWRVEFEAVNVGGSTAKVTSCTFTLTRAMDYLHIPHSHQASKPFSLEPGEEKLMSIPIDRELLMILRSIGQAGLRAGLQNTDKLFFWGRLRYIDGLGISRNTAVQRHYQGSSEMFQIVENSELEYAD